MSQEDDQFDALFASIMAEPDQKPVDVAEEPAVVATVEDSREALIQTLVSQPVVETAKPDQKARVEYKTVEKVEVEGSPFPSKVYPLGYVTLASSGWRFQNKLCLYREEFRQFVDFIRDSAKSDPWLAALDAAGFRNRGEARKEG
jgi:hypothetical protein